MKRLTTLLVSFLSIVTCCADKQPMPKLPLVKISYTYGSQMIAYREVDITIFEENDSIYAITFDIDSIRYNRYLIKQKDVMSRLKDIILKEKMYKYKSSYSNPNVLDGDSWSFRAYFSDNIDARHQHSESIESGGSNKWPKGNGLSAIKQEMDLILSDAEFLYFCNESGERIPDEKSQEDENVLNSIKE